jgi:hypothetical protein
MTAFVQQIYTRNYQKMAERNGSDLAFFDRIDRMNRISHGFQRIP